MSLTVLTAAQRAEWAKAMTGPAKAAFVSRAGAAGKKTLAAFAK
jgi:hypothetical protein